MRLLLVEDEPELVSALTAALSRRGMVTDHAPTRASARVMLNATDHAVVLLDRRLPDGDGIHLVPEFRQRGYSAPIIVLTAQDGIDDRIDGLDYGADDYLAKPFAVDELLARIRAVLRRSPEVPSSAITIESLTFDFSHREARVGGLHILLPRRELLVLEALLRRVGRVVPRESLERAVYGYNDEIHSNALDTHVCRLRRKLVESGAGVEIHTLRGIGYLLKDG